MKRAHSTKVLCTCVRPDTCHSLEIFFVHESILKRVMPNKFDCIPAHFTTRHAEPILDFLTILAVHCALSTCQTVQILILQVHYDTFYTVHNLIVPMSIRTGVIH